MATITGAALVAEVDKLAAEAGYKYIYGGTTTAGFDCSGLIYDALLQLGVANPPRTSEAQYAYTSHISESQLQPGDLVFAQFPGDNASPGHVGIYIGNGNVYSAQDPALGIGVSTLASWGSAIVGYGRLPNVSTSGASGANATLDSSVSSVFSWPSDITGFFGDAKTFVDAAMWLVKPASWLRIGSFGVGIILLAVAIYAFMNMGSGQGISAPKIMPVPI